LDRRNAAQIEQKKKREALQALHRLFTGKSGVPKIVALIPLCPDVNRMQLVKLLFESAQQPVPMETEQFSFLLPIEKQKQTLQLILPERRFIDILDVVKVADFCLFILSAEEEVDKFGELCLRGIQAQGIPSVVNVVQYLDRVPMKRRNDVKKSLSSFMNYFFPDQERVLPADTDMDIQVVIRTLTNQLPRPVKWRTVHPYMLVDHVEFVPHHEQMDTGSLLVTGYARGANFNANLLVHLPNEGDFQLDKILSESGEVLQEADLERRESLQSANEPDLMANEQTWPTEEELREAEERVKEKRKVRVPKGTSAYQAAWIVDSESELSDAYDDSDLSDQTQDEDEAMEEVDEEPIESETEYEEIELETRKDEFDELSPEEEDRQLQEYLERQRELRNEMEFPDEVDTPLNVPARIRFQRYRGLKSFRHTYWDPYENLPIDYARIFRFADYKRTAARVMSEAVNQGVGSGRRLTLQLANVPRTVLDHYQPTRPFIVYGLLQHENKMSVIHFTVTRNSEYTEPVRSKDPLVLHCGFRRYRVQPLYSQNTASGKGSNNVHKFERFLRSDQTSIATVYAPIQFGRVPMVLYRETTDPDEPILVATGTFVSAEPNRILAKRIILSGHPVRVYKRTAVVRYMFFNPEDVRWFKPVELYTKYGRRGHIKESLGTHGYMKCTFDGPLKYQDTVLMNLYKRVFPKWTTELWRDPQLLTEKTS
jgi:pre-rRNA-processing protein TSR1